MTLVIADKNYSLWPLPAWLCLNTAKLPFREVLIRFGQPDTRAQMLGYGPTGRVPVLKHGALAIWDSLAICEYADELKPEAKIWPAARDARAVARSFAAKTHTTALWHIAMLAAEAVHLIKRRHSHSASFGPASPSDSLGQGQQQP